MVLGQHNAILGFILESFVFERFVFFPLHLFETVLLLKDLLFFVGTVYC